MYLLQPKTKTNILSPTASLGEALRALQQTREPALAVIGDRGFVGVVLREDLLRYAPSPANSLSKWELNYLLDTIRISDEKLIKPVSEIEVGADVGKVIEALRQGASPVVAMVAGGKFSQLLSWREILNMVYDERPSPKSARELCVA